MATPKKTNPTNRKALRETDDTDIPAGNHVKKALSEISFAGFIAFVLITLPSMTLASAVAQYSSASLNPNSALTLLDAGIKTAPLTLAVIIIALSAMKQWVSFDDFLSFVVFSTIVLCCTTFLFSGFDMIRTAWAAKGSQGIFAFPIYLLLEYFKMYFWIPFFSAFVVGIFSAYAIYRVSIIQF